MLFHVFIPVSFPVCSQNPLPCLSADCSLRNINQSKAVNHYSKNLKQYVGLCLWQGYSSSWQNRRKSKKDLTLAAYQELEPRIQCCQPLSLLLLPVSAPLDSWPHSLLLPKDLFHLVEFSNPCWERIFVSQYLYIKPREILIIPIWLLCLFGPITGSKEMRGIWLDSAWWWIRSYGQSSGSIAWRMGKGKDKWEAKQELYSIL